MNAMAIPSAIITADGNSLGPRLCTYDAESDTGVLLVISTVTGAGLTARLVRRVIADDFDVLAVNQSGPLNPSLTYLYPLSRPQFRVSVID